MESGVSVSEDYGEDQAATGSAWPEPVVSVRGLVKHYCSRETVAGIELAARMRALPLWRKVT